MAGLKCSKHTQGWLEESENLNTVLKCEFEYVRTFLKKRIPLRFKVQKGKYFSSDWSSPHTAVDCGFGAALADEPMANLDTSVYWPTLLTTFKS